MALRGPKALQEWCRRVTSGYTDVCIKDMSSSFRDGLAFCAIIHHFRPDLIDYDSLKKEDIVYNNQLAFDVAEKKLGIIALLDAPDMALFQTPDKLSIITYVSSYYNYFKDQIPGQIEEKFPEDNNNTVENDKLKSSTPVISLGDVCQACNKKVYLLERQSVNNKLYHRGCYRCYKCNNTLKPGSFLSDSVNEQFECLHCSYEENKLLNENESPSLKVNDLIHSYEKNFVKKDPNSFSSSERRTSSPPNSLIPSIKKSNGSSKPVLKKPAIPVIFKRPKSQMITENKTDEINSVKQNHIGNKMLSYKINEEENIIERLPSSTPIIDKQNSQSNSQEFEKIDDEKEIINHEQIKEIEIDESMPSVDKEKKNLDLSVNEVLNDQMLNQKGEISLTAPEQSPTESLNSVKEEINTSKEESSLNVEPLDDHEDEAENSEEDEEMSTSAELNCDSYKEQTKYTSVPPVLRKIRPNELNYEKPPHRTFQPRKYKTLAITSPSYPQHLNPFLDEKKQDSSANPFDGLDDESSDEDESKIKKLDSKPQQLSGSKQQRRNPFSDEIDEKEDYLPNNLDNSNIADFLESALEELDMGKYESNLSLSQQPQSSTPISKLNSSVSNHLSSSESPHKKPRKKRSAPLPPGNKSKLENGIPKFATMPPSFQTFNAKPRKLPVPPPRIKKIENTPTDNIDKIECSSPSPSKLSLSKVSLDDSGSSQSSPRSRKKKPAPPPPIPQRRKVTNISEFGIPKEAILMELQELDHLQTVLEEKGRDLEKVLRREGEAGSNMEEEMLIHWFEIVNEKNKLVRREAELIYIQRQQELEEKHSDIEYELRCLLEKPMSHKTETDQLREEKLLAELVNIVTERNLIVECIEDERLRHVEEDKGLEEIMSSKGLDLNKKPPKKFKIKSPKIKKNKKK